MPKWVKRWGYEVTATASKGVMKTKDGAWLLFAKVDRRIVTRIHRGGSQRGAEAERLVMIAEARSAPSSSRQRFAEYAPSLYARKVDQREIKSAKTRERWDSTLKLHLLPAFGSSTVGEIEKLQIEEWKTKVAKRIAKGEFSPRTANGWLSILRVILRTAVDDLKLDKDPTLRVRDFSTEEHPTYTDEHPNALTPEQCAKFLSEMRTAFPQFYAMTVLGFTTGLRPSTLRALRRRGPSADVLWSEGALLVRRSNSLGQDVMNTTKTALVYKLGLPPSVMTVLEEHAALLRGKRAESELLFPSKRGGFMSRSALDKPFVAVSRAIGLRFVDADGTRRGLSPRGMRRTYQDIGRKLGIEKSVRKAVCGHATDEMSDLYSTVGVDEMRAAVARLALSVVAA